MKRVWTSGLVGLALAAPAPAAVKGEAVEYRHGDVVLQGYAAWDDAKEGRRPAVLVVHDWTGHNAFARKRADMLAELGYVAFALDMYGKGVAAKDAQDAAAKAVVFKKDRVLMRERAAAGLEVLLAHPLCDARRVACIGYCFGGTTTLELARSGAALAAVVCFHGNLDTPRPEDARQIKGKVLVLHGASDPVVPPAEVAAFQKEMTEARIDWQLVAYGGALHSFTNPAANAPPAVYNRKADERSWRAMRDLFDEAFR